MWNIFKFKNQEAHLLNVFSRHKSRYVRKKRIQQPSYGQKLIGVLSTVTKISVLTTGWIIVYGKYNPQFRHLLLKELQCSVDVFKWIPPFEDSNGIETKDNMETESVPKKKTSQSATSMSMVGKSKADDVISFETCLSKLHKLLQEMQDTQMIAADAMKDYAFKLRKVLGDSQDGSLEIDWTEFEKASENKRKVLETLSEKIINSNKIIIDLKRGIEESDKNLESSDPLVRKVKKQIYEAEEIIKSIEDSIVHTQASINSEINYKALVDDAIKHLKQEFDKTNSESDLKSILKFAHKKIDNLQKEIAIKELTMKDRIQSAVEAQKLEDDRSAKARLITEITFYEKQRKKDFERDLKIIKKVFEDELQAQLTAQLATHMEHYEKVLKDQAERLEIEHDAILNKMLLYQRNQFMINVAPKIKELQKLDDYLKKSNDFHKLFNQSITLWLTCETMDHRLKMWTSFEPISLQNDIMFLQSLIQDKNVFVSTILNKLPSKSLERGIHTHEYLKHRFERVKKCCKKVALVDKHHRGIYRYVLSYIQSFFIIDIVPCFLIDQTKRKPRDLDTFNLLNAVSFYLDKEDLENAFHFANQLKGDPHNVAMDWLSELGLTVETLQAIKCLRKYAEAITIQSLQ